MSEKVAISNVNVDASNGGVLFKLIVFSVSLGVMPLASYYVSLEYLWDGNATFAAITAVVAANVVLVVYIVLSILEDRKTSPAPPLKEKLIVKKNK